MGNDGHKFHAWGQYPEICAGCRADKEEEAADREREHDARIAQLVGDFTKQVAEAERAVYLVHRTVSEMTSNGVYDIEMAEGAEGGDALRELEIASRALRNVRRIAKWRTGLEREFEQARAASAEETP